jgi:hypothetical protein
VFGRWLHLVTFLRGKTLPLIKTRHLVRNRATFFISEGWSEGQRDSLPGPGRWSRVIKLTDTREITLYVWVHPDEER